MERRLDLNFLVGLEQNQKNLLGLSFINTNITNLKLYIVLDVWNKTKENNHTIKAHKKSHNFIYAQFRRSLRLHLARATSLLNHKVTQVDEWSLVRVCSEHTHKVLRVASRKAHLFNVVSSTSSPARKIILNMRGLPTRLLLRSRLGNSHKKLLNCARLP